MNPIKTSKPTTIQPVKLSVGGNEADFSEATIPSILLTIDVEDWFQVENFKAYIPFSSWPKRELRVEKNTHRLLDLFDSIAVNRSGQRSAVSDQPDNAVSQIDNDDGQPTEDNGEHKKVRCTFFVLGWLAERLPHLVREIHDRGHEVASHGYNHTLCNQQSHEVLMNDLVNSKILLEDIIGSQVFGYRAPSFSMSDRILKVIQECGYLYDSSYNSFGMNQRYGRVTMSDVSKKGIAYQVSGNFFELPISNLTLIMKNLELPWGGGGYFRLIPLFLFVPGVRAIFEKDRAYVFYLHPWEIDPEQPRVNNAGICLKFRHYVNLARTYVKQKRLIERFSDCRFNTCSEYIAKVGEMNPPKEGPLRGCMPA